MIATLPTPDRLILAALAEQPRSGYGIIVRVREISDGRARLMLCGQQRATCVAADVARIAARFGVDAAALARILGLEGIPS